MIAPFQALHDSWSSTRQWGQAALRQRLTTLGNTLPPAVLDRSFSQLTFTGNPMPGPLLTEAQHAAAAGLLKPVNSLASICDLAR